ncbi:MAG: hypothetical protein ACD_33C00045G0010 [uncultured bacterium]|nr:MAG: hypothetical protein ACD_33C00045G0010 [uncultured bacterium]
MEIINKQYIKLNTITDIMEYLFIYSDKNNYYFITYNLESKELFLIVTDKELCIDYLDVIVKPNDFDNFKNMLFFKPYLDVSNDTTIYKGIITLENGNHKKFEIKDLMFSYTDDVDEIKPSFSLLPCIANIKVKAHIQKKNHLYLIGHDEKYNEEVFIIVNIELMKIQYLHSFYTDFGYITLNTVNIDAYENKILVGGKIDEYDDKDNYVTTKPYFQMFLNV